jgi:nitrogen fixation NifU-like protein
MPYSERLLDHFRNPRHAGELPSPAIIVEVSNPACGDIMRLWALLEDGKVARASYKVRGCTASIAAGSVLTELMLGKTATELRQLSAGEIEGELGGLPVESKHAAALCLDAVKALADRMS